MKKTLIALAALGVVGTAAAEATVYGRVDAGIKNTGGATTVVSGVTGTPRIGFKGTEDLGGGLKAMFGIETGFNNTAEGAQTTADATTTPADGAGPTRIGDRGAYVGVSGGFGSVMIGSSLLTPSFFVTAATDALGLPNYAPTEARMWGKAHENLRHDSAIQYSNSFSGVTFRLSYVPAGNNSDTAKTNWSAQYSIEGLTVAGASHSAASGKKQNSIIGASYNLGPAAIYWNKASGDTR